MKVTATLALYDFPLWRDSLRAMSKYVDRFIIRVDENGSIFKEHGWMGVLHQIDQIVGDFPAAVFFRSDPWNRWNWREDFLEEIRMLDENPDIIVQLDEDEIFGTGIDQEIKELHESDAVAIMSPYRSPMPTADGTIILNGGTYPGDPHMKIYKYRKGLTFKNYTGWARVTNYADESSRLIRGTVPIYHYCCWTPEMRERKDFKW